MRPPLRISCLPALALVAACAGGQLGPPGEEPPPGGGGDATIDTIFAESFESGSLATWDDGVNPAHHRIVTDGALARHGSRLLEITYLAGGAGGWLTKFFMPGHDSLYVRYHLRFDADWESGTKLLLLRGSRTDDQWSSFGVAGECPDGDDFFATNVVTQGNGDPGPLRFYSYYPGMATEPDGVTCWGRYGSNDAYLSFDPPSLGEWHVLEFFVRLNRPGQSDGVQRFWLDGELMAEWTNVVLRTEDVLMLNSITLEGSNSGPAPPKEQYLLVYDILVATGRPTT